MELTIPIISRRIYTSGATPLDILIARHIDVAGAISGVLVVKVHTAPSGGTWTVHARNGCTSNEDPGIDFSDTSREVVSVAVSGTTYNLWHGSLSAPIGEELDVYLSTPAMIGYIRISVDLVVRDPWHDGDSRGRKLATRSGRTGLRAFDDAVPGAVRTSVLSDEARGRTARVATLAGWRSLKGEPVLNGIDGTSSVPCEACDSPQWDDDRIQPDQVRLDIVPQQNRTTSWHDIAGTSAELVRPGIDGAPTMAPQSDSSLDDLGPDLAKRIFELEMKISGIARVLPVSRSTNVASRRKGRCC